MDINFFSFLFLENGSFITVDIPVHAYETAVFKLVCNGIAL